MQKSKEKTSRIALWREIGIPNIFTMEASFCGCDKGEFAGAHFTIAQLKQMGRDLCRALIVYHDLSHPTPKPALPAAGEASPGFGLLESQRPSLPPKLV